jgi:capsular exopolysaccharide synthesis family protein
VPSADRRDEADVRRVLRILYRRRVVIAIVFVLVVGVAVGGALTQSKVYESTATLLLQPRSSETLFDSRTGQRGDPSRALETEIQVLTSKPVYDKVYKQLGVVAHISATPIGNTDVIAIKSSSGQPARAAAVPNAFANAYVDYKRDQAVEDLTAASKKIQDKIVDLAGQLHALDVQSAAPARADATTAEQITSQRESLVSQQTTLRSQLNQLQLSSSLNSGGAHLVTPADVPTTPVAPRPVRTATVSAFVGLLLAVALAFVVDFLDDSIKSEDDIERALGDIPLMGLIPDITSWKDSKQPLVISQREPNSAAAEAYRALRTSLHFIGLDRPMQVIQVTSPGAREGKTATVANLGVALARTGRRVVIAGCDLRRPRIHTFFGVPNTVGFTSVMLGEVPANEAAQVVADESRLYVLPSGPPPPNPSEMLGSARTDAMFKALREGADVVLVDCPPTRPVTDAAVLSGRVDATLIVVRAGKTTRTQLRRAIDLLRQVDAPVVGAVLNGIGRSDAHIDTYEYSRASGAEPAANGNRPWGRIRKVVKPRS